MKYILIVILVFNANTTFAQGYEQLESEYNAYLKNNNFELAILKAKEMLSYTLKSEGDTSIKFAASYKLIGNTFSQFGYKDSALLYYDEGLKTLKIQQRENNMLTAKFLFNKAAIYKYKKNYNEYFSLLKQSATINKELGYPEFPFSEWLPRELYYYNVSIKNQKEYELLLKEDIYVFQKFNKTNTSQYASVAQSLGTHYVTQQNYIDGEKYLLESTEAYKKSIGENNFDCARNYFWLGTIYNSNENFIKAETFLKKCINILENTKPKSKSDSEGVYLFYNSSIEWLGQFYWGLGIYKQAQEYYNKERNIYIENHDTSNANSVTVSLAISYIDNKQYQTANSVLLEQIKYFNEITEINIEDYLRILGALSITLSTNALNDNEMAKKVIDEKIGLTIKFFSKESKNYLDALKDKCEYFINKGDTQNAVICLNEFENIINKLYKDKNREFALQLSGLATLYGDIGYGKKSITLFQEYFKIITYSKESNDIMYFYNLLDYSKVLLKSHESTLAFETINQLYSLKHDYLLKNIFYLNEHERSLVWKKEEHYFNEIIDFAFKIIEKLPKSSELLYNNSLLTKSFLLKSAIDIRNTVNNSNDSNLINVLNNLMDLKNYAIKLSSKGNVNQDFIEEIDSKADSLDQILSRKMSKYANYKNNFNISWKEIKLNLKSDEVAIEFEKYYTNEDSAYHYFALYIKNNSNYPQIIYLCSEKELNKFLSEIEIDKTYSIWNPLNSLLNNIRTIYLSVAGTFNNVNFSAIPIDSNITFGEKYSLHILGTTADVINYKPTYLNKKSIQSELVFGGIDYDKANNIPVKSDENKDPIGFEQVAELASRSGGGGKFGYLKGTDEETKNIENLCKVNSINAITITGANATEARFKQLSGKKEPFILHIATHGYFFPDPEKKKQNEPMQQIMEPERKNIFKWSDDPLLRSGLIFAGANKAWGNPDYVSNDSMEDGVLTSYEISNLDLSNCQLVVLSACETGLGDIKGSEGVFGLQRAFKMAGVKNIIMSLWKVPDAQTSELMTLFYNYCFSGKNVHDALQAAQTDMRKKGYAPYYWAAFKLLE